MRHAMQPGSQRVPHPEPASFLNQHQERGLKRVLSVVRVAREMTAHSHDHRAVPFDQGCEGTFGRVAVAGREPFQQLGVR